MGKRLVLLVAVCAMLTGCTNINKTVEEPEEVQTRAELVFEGETENLYSIDELPSAIECWGKNINYIAFDFYQTYARDKYIAFSVMTFDISDLNFHDLYWLNEERMNLSVGFSSEKNEIEYTSMEQVCTFKKGETLMVAFYVKGGFEYGFDNIEVNTTVDIFQKDIKDSYLYNIVTPKDVKTLDDMDVDLFTELNSALERIAINPY